MQKIYVTRKQFNKFFIRIFVKISKKNIESCLLENRNIKIQYVRGLAILAVVIIHTCPPGTVSTIIIRSFVNFAVGLFLFLSGYLTDIDSVLQAPISFVVKRFRRVIAPYVFWSAMVSIVNGSSRKLVWNIVTFQSLKSYYFIGVYIQLQILSPVICWIIKRKWSLIYYIMSITPILLIVMYAHIFMGDYIEDSWHYRWFFVWMIYYVFGIWIKSRNYKNSMLSDIGVGILLFLVQILESFIWLKYGSRFNIRSNMGLACSQIKLTSMMYTLFICSMTYSFIRNSKGYLSLNNSSYAKFAYGLGNISFGIYLVHLPVLGLLEKISALLFIDKFLVFPIKTILVVVTSCVIIYALRMLIPKAYWWMIGVE